MLLNNKHPIEVKFSFILVPELVAGLELSVSGWKLTWSVEQHLHTLQENVLDALHLLPHNIAQQTVEKPSTTKQTEPLENEYD